MIGGARFPDTRLSAVEGARSEDPGVRTRSLEAIARAYWLPAYTHVRLAWRRTPDDARDLTQGFFAACLERDTFASFDASRARFRTFLRVCLDRHVAGEAERGGRHKRGGGVELVPFDLAAVEREIDRAAPAEDPEARFDREWIRSVVALAVDDVRQGFTSRGRGGVFEVFAACDLADEEPRPTYAQLATRFGLKVTDVTNHLHAARRQLRGSVLARLRELTASDEEFRSEARLVLGIDPP